MVIDIRPRSPRKEQSRGADLLVSEPNLNPVLQIVTVLLLATTTLMLAARLLTSFILKSKRSAGLEDILILISFAGLVTCELLGALVNMRSGVWHWRGCDIACS